MNRVKLWDINPLLKSLTYLLFDSSQSLPIFEHEITELKIYSIWLLAASKYTGNELVRGWVKVNLIFFNKILYVSYKE